jgi:histidyl-tRNA synthetase
MELLPDEQIEFDRIKNIIETTYKQYGFTTLDTPVIERSEVLLKKTGGETARQIYRFENDKTDLALRFDLTVPLARYVADHFNELSFPFRRCHIAKVYRGEKPQKGRFREFYQCDIDVIGHNELSIKYDAEIPSIIFFLFKKLDFGKFTIRINNRKLLNGLLNALGVEDRVIEVLRIIDKFEKVSADEFDASLRGLGLSRNMIDTLSKFINIKGSITIVLQQLKKLGITNNLFKEGIDELELITGFMNKMHVDESYYTIDLSIARGLDYYTGTVYETILDNHATLGSICSGGRFDDLASEYIDEKLPGVGISIGLTRLFYQLREAGLIPCSKKTIADAVIVPLEDKNIDTALKVSQKLREQGHNVDVLLEDISKDKKLQYVSKKDVPFAILIGSEEEASGLYTLRFIQDEELIKKTVSIDVLLDCMQKRIHQIDSKD